MRKLLLLALLIGFSYSAFAKQNENCVIADSGWVCYTLNGYISSQEEDYDWREAMKRVKSGTTLTFAGPVYQRVAVYCDFNKSIIVMNPNNDNKMRTTCSKV